MVLQKDNKIGPYLDLGLQFAVAIGLGVGLGYVADKKLNTFPLFLLLGLLVGSAAGFLNIYRAVFPGNKKETSDEE